MLFYVTFLGMSKQFPKHIRSSVIAVLLIIATSCPLYASQRDNDLALAIASKGTWGSFNWKNIRETNFYKRLDCKKPKISDSAVDHTAAATIADIAGSVIYRKNTIDKTERILVDLGQVSKAERAKLKSWCIRSYGCNFVESTAVIPHIAGVVSEFSTQQWVVGNTYVHLSCMSVNTNKDDAKWDVSIIFTDKDKSLQLKPDIMLQCDYVINFGTSEKDYTEIYAIEDKLGGDVKNEKMEILPDITSTISNTSITLILDNEHCYRELDLNRLSGKISGMVYSKQYPDLIFKIRGTCTACDKLSPKF